MSNKKPARRVINTYRVRLIHLEADGSVVTDELGEAISEDVEVNLSWLTTITRAQRPSGSDLWALAGSQAATKANAGMATARAFETAQVALFATRSRPLPHRAAPRKAKRK